jgi:hypothetical protein
VDNNLKTAWKPSLEDILAPVHRKILQAFAA